MIKKINHENWCPIHKEWIARNQLECFSCKLEKKRYFKDEVLEE